MKLNIKKTVHGAFLLLTLPLAIIYFIFTQLGSKDSAFICLAQLLSLIPGKLGSYTRTAFFNWTMTHCNQDCHISFGALFSQHDTRINEGVYIGPQCNIGKSTIERNCLLGSGVHILSGKNQHHTQDIETPIREQGGTFENIVIGENSWIGNGAIIMAEIGKHCIVAAGSVVTSKVDDYDIVAGNPAKKIKSRLPKEEQQTSGH